MPAGDPAAVASRLVGSRIDAIEPVRGAGRNSRVYRLRRDGENFALKHYPKPERARVEAGALELMAKYRIGCVPRALAADFDGGWLLLEWVEGEAVQDPQPDDIAASARFLASVHALRTSADAATQPLAAEACLSGNEIEAQIARRAGRLAALRGEPDLAALLTRRIEPLAEAITDLAKAEYRARGLDFAVPLPQQKQSLCPSDFGFHNALRRLSGGIVFLDFDYFGWDDPVKLVADFLLHPGMRLTEPAKRRFADLARDIYARDDPGFTDRLAILYPMFALRWCLILLNEFLPERWEYRVHAGADEDWSAAKRRQLDRVNEWVQSLEQNYRRFPYAR
jgi:hypothetical protein